MRDELGRCDALVNNAAIDYDTDARATTADLDRVHRALETNLFGAWRTALAFLPLLRRSPHPRLVNVSSGSGSISEMGAGTPAYSVSKAALNALTRILAAELRARPPSSSTPSAPAGSRPTWAAPGGRPVADGARERRRGRCCSTTTGRRAGSSATVGPSRGERRLCTKSVPSV